MFYLNTDDNGYLLSVAKINTGGPSVDSLDGFDLSGDRLLAHRWDGEKLILDETRLAELEQQSAATQQTIEKAMYDAAVQQEIQAALLAAQVNTLDVDDDTALRWKAFYPTFATLVGKTVKNGFRFTYGDKLWSVCQPELTIQAHYPPGAGTESLYIEVNTAHAGTLEDPIPYGGNMALAAGLYYTQDGAVYLCTRDTGNPVYHALSELAGIYVEEVSDPWTA